MMATYKTTLSEREKKLAAVVALLRFEAGEAAHADNGKHGNTKDGFLLHQIGAYAEMAFAKVTNQYWTGAGDTYQNESDVGKNQVRSTEWPDGSLLIRPEDMEKYRQSIWVLMIGSADKGYRFAGWIRGFEGERKEYLADPKGRGVAYFVPQNKLHTPEEYR
jgi:hypothetical protein